MNSACPKAPRNAAGRRIAGLAIVTIVLGVAAVPLMAFGEDFEADTRMTIDPAGVLESSSTNAFNPGRTKGFFASLGTNGRKCSTCHLKSNAWSFTPAHARALESDDPLFTPNDGSDCPPLTSSQRSDSRQSSQLLDYGLIRVQLAIPATANFTLQEASNPKECAIAPGSSENGGQLFLFRRPLPSTNLVFDSAVMWDGRETLHPIATAAGQQGLAALLFDLADQANSATTGHAQGAPIAGSAAQSDIVAFEMGLYTGQRVLLSGGRAGAAPLDSADAHGGAGYLQDTTAPAFFIGVNDPLKPGFTNAIFDLYAAWEPDAPGYAELSPMQQAVGRGEALFNNARFVIHDVPGLNSAASNPLYNPADPLAGQDIVAGCGLCHNNPNVGNHSSSLPINIGVTMSSPANNDGSANTSLDLANLPVYSLRNSITGAVVQVTDPGKAMLSGKWTDIGKTKGPMLRGLSARAPYFHNGSAKDLATVVQFYDARFSIGLTQQQSADLVAFLEAL
jgi:cytochrome c peroxidase